MREPAEKPDYQYHVRGMPSPAHTIDPDWDDDNRDVIVLTHDGHEYRPRDRDDGL